MFNKKQIIILIILIFILIGGIFLYRQKYQQKGSGTVSPTPTASPETSIAKDPREIVMEDAAAKIAELSPEEPVMGGHWFASRFWFIDGSNNTFYVEYEDGHILRQLLLVADTSQAPEKISYAIKAYFTPGESDWVLKSGQDDMSGRSLILYEYNEQVGRWVQKN
ncbi:MAG: hypothetical protein V1845_02310 [bacterium]